MATHPALPVRIKPLILRNAQQETSTSLPNIGKMSLAGLCGAVLGLIPAVAFSKLFPDKGDRAGIIGSQGTRGAVVIASYLLVFEPLGLSLGVHYADGKKGDLAEVFGATFFGTVLCAAAALPTFGVSVFALPVVQLAMAIRKERATAIEKLRIKSYNSPLLP